MPGPNPAEIAAKCVEVSKSLLNTQVGLHGFDLATTRRAGDFARFATAIRRARLIESPEQLAAVSNALKIEYRLLETDVVPTLEEFDWLRVIRDGKKIRRIEESIPPVEDVLSTIGKYWDGEEPTDVDRATVAGLTELSRRPYEKSALMSEIEVDPAVFDIVTDYGNQARYIGSFQSRDTGKEVIWYPLYWARNAEPVQKFLERQEEPAMAGLAKLTRDFRRYPGMPIERVSGTESPLVRTGIHFGYFPTPLVKDRKGNAHEYVFPAAPQFDVDGKRDLFELGRLIVACIRHGQHHAEVSRILYPGLILRALRTNSLGPHSYAKIQYFPLEQFGVVRIVPAKIGTTTRYRVEWIETPENNMAADIAHALLRRQEPPPGASEEREARKILVQGVFSDSSEQRRIKTAQSLVAKDEFERLMEMTAGVRV